MAEPTPLVEPEEAPPKKEEEKPPTLIDQIGEAQERGALSAPAVRAEAGKRGIALPTPAVLEYADIPRLGPEDSGRQFMGGTILDSISPAAPSQRRRPFPSLSREAEPIGVPSRRDAEGDIPKRRPVDYSTAEAPQRWNPEPQEIDRLVLAGLLDRKDSADNRLVWQAGRADLGRRGGMDWVDTMVAQELVTDVQRGESAVQKSLWTEVPVSMIRGVPVINTLDMARRAESLWLAKIYEEEGDHPWDSTEETQEKHRKEAKRRAARTMTRVMQSGGRRYWADPLERDLTDDIMESNAVWRMFRALAAPVRYGSAGYGTPDAQLDALARSQLILSGQQLKYENPLVTIGRFAPSTLISAGVSTGTWPWERESIEAVRAGEDVIYHINDVARWLAGKEQDDDAPGWAQFVSGALIIATIIREPDLPSLILQGPGALAKSRKAGKINGRLAKVARVGGPVADLIRAGKITVPEASSRLQALDEAVARAVEMNAGAKARVGGVINEQLGGMYDQVHKLRKRAEKKRAQVDDIVAKYEGEYADRTAAKLQSEADELEYTGAVLGALAAEAEKNAFLLTHGLDWAAAERVTSRGSLTTNSRAAREARRNAKAFETKAADLRRIHKKAFESYEEAAENYIKTLEGLSTSVHTGKKKPIGVEEVGREAESVGKKRTYRAPVIGQELSFKTEAGGTRRGIVEDIEVVHPNRRRPPKRRPKKNPEGGYHVVVKVRTSKGIETVKTPYRVDDWATAVGVNASRDNFMKWHEVVARPEGPLDLLTTYERGALDARAFALAIEEGGPAAGAISRYEEAISVLKGAKKKYEDSTKAAGQAFENEEALFKKWLKAEPGALKAEAEATLAKEVPELYASAIDEVIQGLENFRTRGLANLGLIDSRIPAALDPRQAWKARKLSREQIKNWGTQVDDAAVESTYRGVVSDTIALDGPSRTSTVQVSKLLDELEASAGPEFVRDYIQSGKAARLQEMLDEVGIDISPRKAAPEVADEAAPLVKKAEARGSDGEPPVGIKGYSKEQLEEVVEGFGNDAVGLARWLAKNVDDPSTRVILNRITPHVAGWNIVVAKSGTGQKYPASIAAPYGTRGLTATQRSEPGGTIYLRGAASDHSGMNVETITHELIHAATIRRMETARLVANQGTDLQKTWFELRDVLQAVIRKRRVQRTVSEANGETLQEFLGRIGSPKTLDIDEMVAWGLTNKKFQDFLQTVKVEGDQTAFSAFVDIVRRLLGIPKAEKNALTEVIRLTEDVLRADVQDLPARWGRLERGLTEVSDVRPRASVTRPFEETAEIQTEVRDILRAGEVDKLFESGEAWGRAVFNAWNDLNLVRTKGGTLKLWGSRLDRIAKSYARAGNNIAVRMGEVGPELETSIIEIDRLFSRAQLELTEVGRASKLGETPEERLTIFMDATVALPLKEGMTRWVLATGNGSIFSKGQMQILADTRINPRLYEVRKEAAESLRQNLAERLASKLKKEFRVEGEVIPGSAIQDAILKGLDDDLLFRLTMRGDQAFDGVPKSLVAVSRMWIPGYALKNIATEEGIMLLGAARTILKNSKTYEEFAGKMRKATHGILGDHASNAAKAHASGASGFMLGATLGEFGHRMDKVFGGKITASEAADVNRILAGSYDEIGDLSQGLEALNKLGIPFTQQEIRVAKGLTGDLNDLGVRSKELIEIGTREGGSSFVPRAAIEEVEKRAARISKDLRAQALAPRQLDTTKWMLSQYLNLWRGSAVTGLIVPNPRYWTNNIMGDFSQLWIGEGLGFAARRSFINFPTNIPLFGRGMQLKSLYMAEKIGGKSGRVDALPGIIETFFNPHLGALFAGKSGEFVTKNGDVVTYDQLRKMALEDGISETFIREELMEMYSRSVKGAKSWEKAFDSVGDWNRVIADHANLVQERQRVGMYADLILRGVPRKEAALRTKRALYDWSHGIAEWEARTVARLVPFWRFWRLSLAQCADALIEPMVRPSREITRKALTGRTKAARLRQQLLIWPSMPDFIDPRDDRAGLSTQAKMDLLARELYPDWQDTRAKLGVVPIDPTRRKYWAEMYGKEYTHESILLPTTTATDSMDMLFGLMVGLGSVVGSVIEKVPGAKHILPDFQLVGDWEAKFWEPVLSSTNPFIETPIRAALDWAGADLDYTVTGAWKQLSPTDEEVFRFTPYFKSKMQYDKDTGRWKVPTIVYMKYRMMPVVPTQISGWMGAIKNPEWDNGFFAGTTMMLRKLTRFGDVRPFNANDTLKSRIRDIEEEFKEVEQEFGDVRKVDRSIRIRGKRD